MEAKTANNDLRILDILQNKESEILSDWMQRQLSASTLRRDLISDAQLNEQSRTFLSAFRDAMRSGEIKDIHSSNWAEARNVLGDLSRQRARQGFSPTETATFIFSLKEALFNFMRSDSTKSGEELVNELINVSILLDKLGLYTTEVFQQNREEIINRQQQEMLELSTPVVRLWEGVLALPLIGTLDSARTQIVMENLLQRIVETGSSIAIIDITGVPLVDTLVAQHLLKTVAAARLMGADCIISGIRPQIAQTIVHLGVDLANVTTKATLADAFIIALERTGQKITTEQNRSKEG